MRKVRPWPYLGVDLAAALRTGEVLMTVTSVSGSAIVARGRQDAYLALIGVTTLLITAWMASADTVSALEEEGGRASRATRRAS
ncbi:MAG: hypothetical protein QNM02_08310 [Acidimicrobiia bacterium]|nr:hypothetical protein [Acidimicrobiia bacterium]